jgi:hypothetical protein
MNPLCSVSVCQAPSFRNIRVQAHVGVGTNCLRNENCDNETVDRDNTGHDDGDKGLQTSVWLATCAFGVPIISYLHDQVRPEGSHTGDTDA